MSDPEKLRFCRDCAWFRTVRRSQTWPLGEGTCEEPRSYGWNLVTGVEEFTDAHVLRRERRRGACGPAGHWYKDAG